MQISKNLKYTMLENKCFCHIAQDSSHPKNLMKYARQKKFMKQNVTICITKSSNVLNNNKLKQLMRRRSRGVMLSRFWQVNGLPRALKCSRTKKRSETVHPARKNKQASKDKVAKVSKNTAMHFALFFKRKNYLSCG